MQDPKRTPPMLLVDLGDDLAVGHAARVEFHLVCHGYEQAPAVVRTRLSAVLDGEHWETAPRFVTEGPWHWSFTQTLLLTRQGRPCPPGRYDIQVEVEFPAAPPGGPGRFLRTALPLRVPDAGSSTRPRLEIVVEDTAIVDLSRLGNFSDVVLRASKQGILSIDDFQGRSGAAPANPPTEGRSFQLPLKPNHDRVAELPFVAPAVARGSARQALQLAFPDGRRSLVFAQDRLQLGRAPDKGNDVLLRWLPAPPQHEPLTWQISSAHLRLKLAGTGLEIEDLGSSNGTQLDGVALPPRQARRIEPTSDGTKVTVAGMFELGLRLFVPPSDVPPPTAAHVEAVGASTLPPLWHRAAKARVEAVRVERRSNLPGEEYVLLCRQALLGPGEECPLRLAEDDGCGAPARIFHLDGQFWLERLTDHLEVAIDSRPLARRELLPLAAGQQVVLGSSRLAVSEPQQELTRSLA